jgi:CO/xanthine dehydrogenase FAD-binding subunit
VYARPRTLPEAVAALSAGTPLVLSGGTDVYPAHVGRSLGPDIVDLSRVEGLAGITTGHSHVRIGATTTWSEVIAAPLPSAFDALKQAAREVGSVQIQNRGTVGGNLCNASPAADGVPPLLALDAEIELVSVSGRRRLPLSAFITGYRRTALARGELVTAILVKRPPAGMTSAFVKLGARRYLVISMVMAAGAVRRDSGGRIIEARVALGAASPVACRLPELERDLSGLAPGVRPSTVVTRRHVVGLSPIDDVRATAAYRLDAAITVAGAALDRAAGFTGDV